MRRTAAILCGLLLLTGGTAHAGSFTFTDGADWDAGTYQSTNSQPNPPGTALKLDANTVTNIEHIWVALSGRDGVARIDTNYVEPTGGGYNGDQVVTLAEMLGNSDGPVIGEYLSRPNGRSGNPSRTTTDLNGDVWVGNRDESAGGKGSVVKISASPTGTTSTGVWNGSTFNRLDWSNSGGVDNNGGTSTASDTAIVNYVRTNSPNVRAVAVDSNNDVWVGGYTTHLHELLDGDTGAPVGGAGNSFNSGRGGYGALVDSNGVVWSASWPDGTNTLVRHDPSTNTTTNINMGRNTYGLGIDNEGDIWVANWNYGTVQQVKSNGTILGTYGTGTTNNRGVAITPDDNNVWVAGSGSAKVARLANDGTLLGTINVGNTPTGVAVDSNGKVWVTNYDSNTVMRIDPDLGAYGAVDLTIELGSTARPYNYSDMTGSVLFGSTIPTGIWSYTQDSGAAGTIWDQIFWNQEAEGSVPVGTSITIEARAADTLAGLASAAWDSYLSGDLLSLVGQYLQIKATLTRSGTGPDAPTPILSDITVTTQSTVPEPATLAIWSLLGGSGLGLACVRRRRQT